MDALEITEAAALDALAPEWWNLFESCPGASPFQSPEWLLPWRRAFLAQGLWTVAVRSAGALVGIAAFFVHVRPEDGRRQLTLLGNGITDRLDMLAAPGHAGEVAEAVFGRLAERSALWDCCDFRDLAEDSPLLSARMPLAVDDAVTRDEVCPVARLPADPAEVVGALSRKRRYNIRRAARRVRAVGEVSYGSADEESRRGYLGALVRLHASRWRSRGEPGVLHGEAVRSFQEEATAGLLRRGLLRIDVLMLDGRTIAAHYGLRRGARAFSYVHGFDPDLASFGPSTLLIAHVLEEAARTGAREFDFLRGPEAYKYDWGAEDRIQFRRQIRK